MEDISVEEVYLCKTRRDFPVDMLPSCEDKLPQNSKEVC